MQFMPTVVTTSCNSCPFYFNIHCTAPQRRRVTISQFTYEPVVIHVNRDDAEERGSHGRTQPRGPGLKGARKIAQKVGVHDNGMFKEG